MPVNQQVNAVPPRAPIPAPLRRWDIRVKLLGFLAILIWAFLFESPLYQLIILLPVAVTAAVIDYPLEKIKALLVSLAPLFLLIIFFTGFANPPQRFFEVANRMVLWQFPGLPGGQFFGIVTRGGIMLGFTFIMRIVLLATASAIFTFIAPVEDLLQFFQKLRFPYELSFIIITALRFIPILDRKRLLILDAQRARGAHRHRKGLKNWFQAQIPVMVPLVINSIIMADTLSMAMLNRGFGYAPTRTHLRQLSFTVRDYWAAGVILSVLTAAIYLRFGLRWGRL